MIAVPPASVLGGATPWKWFGDFFGFNAESSWPGNRAAGLNQTANACDLNGDGSVDILDEQAAVNMALGYTPCTSTVLGPGVCNIVLVQRETNAILTGACVTGALP
jgi:hypothetical protein